jgi:tetratricopeptide (TPR) repeat protein
VAQAQERLTPLQQRAQYKLRSGVIDFHANQLAAARAKFEEALDLDHELIDARLWLAHVLLAQGDAKAALEQYQAGLIFSPRDRRLQEALPAAQVAVAHARTPEARDEAAAKQRLIPNLILSGLIPPSGIVLGLWEIVTARTEEWRELGLKTLLVGVAALVVWIIIVLFIGVIVEGGIAPAGPGP